MSLLLKVTDTVLLKSPDLQRCKKRTKYWLYRWWVLRRVDISVFRCHISYNRCRAPYSQPRFSVTQQASVHIVPMIKQHSECWIIFRSVLNQLIQADSNIALSSVFLFLFILLVVHSLKNAFLQWWHYWAEVPAALRKRYSSISRNQSTLSGIVPVLLRPTSQFVTVMRWEEKLGKKTAFTKTCPDNTGLLLWSLH